MHGRKRWLVSEERRTVVIGTAWKIQGEKLTGNIEEPGRVQPSEPHEMTRGLGIKTSLEKNALFSKLGNFGPISCRRSLASSIYVPARVPILANSNQVIDAAGSWNLEASR